MLIGVDPVLTPELLYALAAMGHGDEICLADAHFPAASVAGGGRLIRLPGLDGPRVLAALLSVLPLDDFVPSPACAMAVVDDPEREPEAVAAYRVLLARSLGRPTSVERLERFAFYERARAAFAIVATGERRTYGNLLLRKGLVREGPP
jgi:L-fucose mutarotase